MNNLGSYLRHAPQKQAVQEKSWDDFNGKSTRAHAVHQFWVRMNDFKATTERKKKNWKRYCTYCRANRIADSEEARNQFKKLAVKKGGHIKAPSKQMIAIKLSHVETWELHAFFKKCEAYDGSFSKAFFGALKVK